MAKLTSRASLNVGIEIVINEPARTYSASSCRQLGC